MRGKFPEEGALTPKFSMRTKCIL